MQELLRFHRLRMERWASPLLGWQHQSLTAKSLEHGQRADTCRWSEGWGRDCKCTKAEAASLAFQSVPRDFLAKARSCQATCPLV